MNTALMAPTAGTAAGILGTQAVAAGGIPQIGSAITASDAAGMKAGSPSFGSIEDLDVKGKRVFIRADLNVPMKDGEITDDTRIRAALPTINCVLGRGGSVVLASHLGRPKGKPDSNFSLAPVGHHLAHLLKDKSVIISNDTIGPQAQANAEMLNPGHILLLENLRFDPGETDNDEVFAAELAALADVYVNDAFGTAHRAHASTVGMVKFFNEKAAGILLQRELDVITKVLETPDKPFVSVLGGAKVSDKLGVVKSLLAISDAILIGGAMAYTFLRARGTPVGKSLVEEKMLDEAFGIMVEAELTGTQFFLPSDHLAAANTDEAEPTVIDTESIPEGLIGLDIGPKTRTKYWSVIGGNLGRRGAKTVFWNGPMGLFEDPRYAAGTNTIAWSVAQSSAFSVIGGGDSVAAVKQAKLANDISHISTGGGAMLNLVAGKKLPGVEALKD